MYGEKSAETLTGMFGSDEAAEIGKRLKGATMSRRIAMETGDEKIRAAATKELYEAVGHLRGLSNTIRVSPAIRL